MKHYKEIDLLNDLIEKQQLRLVSISELYEGISLIPVQFQFQNKVFEVLIDDEYNDLSIKNNTLNILLVLRSLAIIDDSKDYLEWINFHNQNASSIKLLDYYKNIIPTIENIKSTFKDGEIECFISDLDFELNAGAMQLLRGIY